MTLVGENDNNVYLTSYKVKYETKTGLNLAISYYNNHAFLIIIAKNWNGHNEVYLSDANNASSESDEETQELINEMLTDIGVNEAKIIMQNVQRRRDLCAYTCLAAAEEFIKLTNKAVVIPRILTFKKEKVSNILRSFGVDESQSETTNSNRGYFAKGDQGLISQCSFCTEYRTNRRAPYIARRAHEIAKHSEEFEGKMRQFQIIRKT